MTCPNCKKAGCCWYKWKHPLDMDCVTRIRIKNARLSRVNVLVNEIVDELALEMMESTMNTNDSQDETCNTDYYPSVLMGDLEDSAAD